MTRPLQRILLVEDDADIRTIAITVLQAVGGFTVLACASGEEAIRRAPEADADLILLDVMMPGLDGPATLRRLREMDRTAAIPVAFMTAKGQKSEIEELKALGAFAVITKPFDPMGLPAQLRELWQRHLAVESPAAPEEPADVDPELEEIMRGYAEHVPAMIEEVRQLRARVAAGGDPAALKALHRALHSMAGSGRTFGFGRLGDAAKALEDAISPWLQAGAPPRPVMDSLVPMFEKLERAASDTAR